MATLRAPAGSSSRGGGPDGGPSTSRLTLQVVLDKPALVGLSIALLTAYFGESASGALHAVQRGFMEAMAPLQEGAQVRRQGREEANLDVHLEPPGPPWSAAWRTSPVTRNRSPGRM